jgi:hypothetical protein
VNGDGECTRVLLAVVLRPRVVEEALPKGVGAWLTMPCGSRKPHRVPVDAHGDRAGGAWDPDREPERFARIEVAAREADVRVPGELDAVLPVAAASPMTVTSASSASGPLLQVVTR